MLCLHDDPHGFENAVFAISSSQGHTYKSVNNIIGEETYKIFIMSADFVLFKLTIKVATAIVDKQIFYKDLPIIPVYTVFASFRVLF